MVICLLLGVAGCSESDEFPKTKNSGLQLPLGTGFDFYVLALSWSPSYCESEAELANRQQCSTERNHGFIVHGLWPQFKKGWPTDCPVDATQNVSQDLMRQLYSLMPSAALIRYQWKKHGSCTGLSIKDYFATLRAAAKRIKIPKSFLSLNQYRIVSPVDLENLFVSNNPGLTVESVAVTCDEKYLREIRICLTKSLEFRTCPNVDRRSCDLDHATMPPSNRG